jgi:hypothetical protein
MISNPREDQFTKIGQNASVSGVVTLLVQPEGFATASTPGTRLGNISNPIWIVLHSCRAIPTIFNHYSGLYLGTH